MPNLSSKMIDQTSNPFELYLLSIVKSFPGRLDPHFRPQFKQCFAAAARKNMRILPEQLEVSPNFEELSNLLGCTGNRSFTASMGHAYTWTTDTKRGAVLHSNADKQRRSAHRSEDHDSDQFCYTVPVLLLQHVH